LVLEANLIYSMDELMQEARFYRLNGKLDFVLFFFFFFFCTISSVHSDSVDLLKLKWNNLPVITQGNTGSDDNGYRTDDPHYIR